MEPDVNNEELKAMAWRRLWSDRWFVPLLGSGILLGVCASAAQVVLRGILGRLHVQNWICT